MLLNDSITAVLFKFLSFFSRKTCGCNTAGVQLVPTAEVVHSPTRAGRAEPLWPGSGRACTAGQGEGASREEQVLVPVRCNTVF